MSEEILINITPMESRVAVVENGVLQEVHVERTQRRGIVGNIYKGKVVRVLPGMQAAFVDIGLERAAFIHASEISQREGSAVENITALVHEGQALVVQVTKDPIGTKGARLTTQLSIPSRYLVYMPRSSHVGISLKIEDEAERERLKQVVSNCMESENIKDAGGFILRTAAEGARAEEILQDIRYLRRLWEQIGSQIKTTRLRPDRHRFLLRLAPPRQTHRQRRTVQPARPYRRPPQPAVWQPRSGDQHGQPAQCGGTHQRPWPAYPRPADRPVTRRRRKNRHAA